MSIPGAPALTTEQIANEILAVLKSGTGFCYKVIWDRVIGAHFRCSPENNQRFQHALQSLARRGQVMTENGWYALRKGEVPGEVKAVAFSRESMLR
jgi:hypothetical protein